MPVHGWIALAILIVAAVLFLTRRLPLEATAIGIPLALFLTGTVPEAEVALQGFGNQAVIALASVFVLGAAMQSTGVAELVARRLGQVGGGERRLVVVVSVAVAVLSAFMSNAATVAVLLPGIVALAARSGIPASRLLMPTGFAAILGGNLTLIGTAPNLLLSEHLRLDTGTGFGMFDFALVGLPIVVAGIATMAGPGMALLPRRAPSERLTRGGLPGRLAKEYGLAENLTRLRIGKNSKLAGKQLVELDLANRYDVIVVLVGRREGLGLHWHVPTSDFTLQRGDDVYLEGDTEDLWLLAEEQHTRIGLAGQHQVEAVLDQGIRLAEVLVGPRSTALGKTLHEVGFRRQFRVSVLTLWRGEEKLARGLSTTPLQMGDTLLVAGSAAGMRRLREADDFVVMGGDDSGRDVRKAPLALGLLAVALVPPLFGWAPLAISALLGALLAVLTKCVRPVAAARAIEWPVLALIVGTLPLGHALQVHGVAGQAADALLAVTQGAGAAATLAALFGAAAIVSVTSSNAAAAVILAPVASAIAASQGMPPTTPLLAVAYGCSCAFLVPFAHQCNLMVAAPGGYRTLDFVKLGSLMTLVVAGVATGLLAVLA
jgi:di/tricarboxylate transporter